MSDDGWNIAGLLLFALSFSPVALIVNTGIGPAVYFYVQGLGDGDRSL